MPSSAPPWRAVANILRGNFPEQHPSIARRATRLADVPAITPS
ncbi:hypothetical protein QA648_26300 (plasmid) [Rhizobium sp. CB3171]|nr:MULTISPECIES: hypothetical protein [unclassified Rhizobium]WFU04303.1 hypothetical protein QA648_26300 [Rhizobium sp. CB3171]